MSEVLQDWVCEKCKTVNSGKETVCAACKEEKPLRGGFDWAEMSLRIILAVIAMWHLYQFMFSGLLLDWRNGLDWYNDMGEVVRAVSGAGVICCLVAQLKLKVDFCGKHPSFATAAALSSVCISELIFILVNCLLSLENLQDLFTTDLMNSIIIPLVIFFVTFFLGKLCLKLADVPPKRKNVAHKLRDPQKGVAIILGVMAVWHIIRVVLMVRDYETDNIMFVCSIIAIVLCGLGILFTLKDSVEGFRSTIIWVALFSIIFPDSVTLLAAETVLPFGMSFEIPVPGISWGVIAVNWAVLLFYMDELLVFYASNSSQDEDENSYY